MRTTLIWKTLQSTTNQLLLHHNKQMDLEKKRETIEKIEKLSTNGFQKTMEDKLDATMTPGSRASAVLAIGDYPAITVPAGYDTDGMPFGICFGGLEGTEPKMIEIAYAFEQATKVRMPPPHLLSKISLSDE